MGQYAVEESSLILNGNGFTDYMDGDFIELTPVNPATSQIRSKNSVVGIKRADAGVYDLTVRLLRNSDDDVFLQNKINQDFEFLSGTYIVNINQSGIPSTEVYKLDQGSITTQPTAVYNNTDGNAMMEYVIRFNNVLRSL